MDKYWLTPANTRQYLFKATEKKGYRPLYVRFKRFNPHWDTQWNDLIREAGETLAGGDHWFDRVGEERVVGANDPTVLLAVGVEVRLFEWKQGFDDNVQGDARKKRSSSGKMTELKTGRIYDIRDGSEKGGREDVDRFLTLVAERFRAPELCASAGD